MLSVKTAIEVRNHCNIKTEIEVTNKKKVQSKFIVKTDSKPPYILHIFYVVDPWLILLHLLF